MQYLKSGLLFNAKAFAMHLLISLLLVVILIVPALYFWYPYPYQYLSGGWHLLWILIAVDVLCGPLLTGLVCASIKSRRELIFDCSVVACIQLGALLFGMYSIALARPVILAFEVDRFVVVSAAEVDENRINLAASQFRILSWSGPKVVGVRAPKDDDELFESLNASLQGQNPSARPDWWVEYKQSKDSVLARMRSIDSLRGKLEPLKVKDLDAALDEFSKGNKDIFYLPLVSKKSLDEWVVLLDISANIVGYAPVDGFQ